MDSSVLGTGKGVMIICFCVCFFFQVFMFAVPFASRMPLSKYFIHVSMVFAQVNPSYDPHFLN